MTTQTESTTTLYGAYATKPYYNKAGEERTSWTRVGIARPHRSGQGFSVQLHSMPLNGKIVLFPLDRPETPQGADAQPA
jgi:hypothetical protein